MPPFRITCLTLSLLALPTLAAAQTSVAWPPRVTFADGTRLALSTNLAWDIARVDDDGTGVADDQGWRRRELGVSLRRDGVYDINVLYDLHNELWLDAAVRVETKALFGHDVGRLRAGHMKLHTSMEGVAANRAGSFLENSAATQAFYQIARSGLTWTLERPQYLIDVGLFNGDFHGDNNGQTQMLRAAWTPAKQDGDVLHLGVALSREQPDGITDGRGNYAPASVRYAARTGAALSAVKLVDTARLEGVERNDRQTLQALWIAGPFSLQGEYYWQQTHLDAARPTYRSDGYYATVGWLPSGQARRYAGGTYLNPLTGERNTATELLARYSSLDLDSDGITGGRMQEATLGVNWYYGVHWKLQANYTWSRAHLRGTTIAPHMLQFRTQFQF